MKETNTIYKLATLYMLSKADTPISTNKLSLFLLMNDYTDYFTFQQGLNDLVKDGLVDKTEQHGRTLYSLTDEGNKTLSLLKKELSSDMKKDIDRYIKENKISMREELSVQSKYHSEGLGQYISNLSIEENGHPLIEINLSSSTEEAAERICTNWKKSSEEVYPILVGMLMH